mmetsp:Transcript_77580/g.195126  ORF Transcript_77580/g.195126 Transcript_77580/m.195126 type:complete len:248 (-) Transcript_77580:272-1015(-)
MACPPEDVGLVAGFERGGVLHRTQQGNDHAQRIHRGLLAALVHMPKVRHSAMGSLKLFDQRARCALADKVRCDEARAAVDLSHFVGQHIPIVVVASHAKSATCPTDDLHCGCITDEVHEIATRAAQKASSQILLLIVSIKDLLHLLPEALLPLEDSLLRHNVGHDRMLQAASEEDVSEVLDVVQRVVIHNDGTPGILALAGIDDDSLVLHVLREEGCQHTPLADLLPSGTILSTDGMPLEEDRPLES